MLQDAAGRDPNLHLQLRRGQQTLAVEVIAKTVVNDDGSTGFRIGIGAQAVGIAQAALDGAVSYAKVRKQFGRRISEFQLTQAKLADMAMGVDAARLLVRRAAALLSRGKRCTKEASMAKLFATVTANRVAYDAVQIHGGNGYIREFPVERYFRDARAGEIYEGTSEIQRLIIAREVLRERAS